jgi:hypothetical protein
MSKKSFKQACLEVDIKKVQDKLGELHKKYNLLKELNDRCSKRYKERKSQLVINHKEIDFLKCEILKLNRDYKFTDSGSFAQKSEIRKRDNDLCCFCKRNIFDVSRDATLHHKIPKRYNGLDTPENQITICGDCHNLLEELINSSEKALIKKLIEQIAPFSRPIVKDIITKLNNVNKKDEVTEKIKCEGFIS